MSFKEFIKQEQKIEEMSNVENEIRQVFNKENIDVILEHLDKIASNAEESDLMRITEIKKYLSLIKNNLPVLQMMVVKFIK